MQLIKALQWRYATKKYDKTKKISPTELEQIKQAIQLTPTSFGLQLFKVFITSNETLRVKLRTASYDQPQITDASHLLIFCSYNNITREHINDYIDLKSQVQQIERHTLEEYGTFIASHINNLTVAQQQQWMAKQVYLALAHAIDACALLKIDSSPMEGFIPKKYDEILQLAQKNLTTCVLLAIGYRSKQDETQHEIKVRKHYNRLFEQI